MYICQGDTMEVIFIFLLEQGETQKDPQKNPLRSSPHRMFSSKTASSLPALLRSCRCASVHTYEREKYNGKDGSMEDKSTRKSKCALLKRHLGVDGHPAHRDSRRPSPHADAPRASSWKAPPVRAVPCMTPFGVAARPPQRYAPPLCSFGF